VELEAVAAALAPRLTAYAMARTGSRETAEDIAQEALTALVRRWRTLGPPEQPDAFAFSIAKRRAGRANARRLLLAPLDILRERPGDTPSAEQLAVDRSELTVVLSAIRTLSRGDREAMLLRAVGRLGFDEIAAITKSTPAAVKMRISRARRTLTMRLPEQSHGRRTRSA
jgi:RNA polymerase sigma-70 factor (ECF subfamily)